LRMSAKTSRYSGSSSTRSIMNWDMNSC
jgi:hypothetical protein